MTPARRRTRPTSRRAAPSPTCGSRSPGADVDVVDDIDLELRPGRGRRPGRRVRLRQDHRRAPRCSPTPGAARSSSAARSCSRARTCSRLPWQQVREIRGEEDRLRAAGPGRRAQPGHPDRPADRGAAGAARHRHGRGAPRGRPRRAARGRPARRRRVPRAATPHQLSGGQVQRVALAMAFLPRAQGAGARRADHRPRRHHPGHGAADHGRAVPQPRGRGALRHPRPGRRRQHRRPGRGDVRGPDRRARARGTRCSASPRTPTRGRCSTRSRTCRQARALTGIPGSTPAPGARPTGCRFNDRCEYVERRAAARSSPSDVQVGPDHTASACGSARSAPGTSTAATPPTPTRTPRGTSS